MFNTVLRLQTTWSSRLIVGRNATRLLATAPPPPPASDSPARPKSSPPSTPADNVADEVPPVPKESEPLEAAPQEEAQQPLNVSVLPSLDFDPASSLPLKGGRTGARSARDSPSTVEAKKRRMGRLGMALLATGLVGGWVFMGRDWEEGEKVPTKEGVMPDGRIQRANARILDLFDTLNKPAWDELLPKAQHKPYTLLLSMDDLLVTSTWDRQNGWRTAKRPGVDYFLAYLSQFYEIVIFTTQYSYTANPILEKLDPYNSYIAYRLYREAARSVGSKVVKDLTFLNRDLSKVILVDTHPEHISAQPENSILMPKWTGNPGDTNLVGLIPLIESIGIIQPPDVRPILKQYQGKDVVKAFALREAEMKQKAREDWQRAREGKRTGSSSGVSQVTLSSLFGGSVQTVDPSQPPPTFLEIKRKEAQEAYRREAQWIKENEAELKRMIEEDKERMMAEGGSLLGLLTGMGQKPPEGDQVGSAGSSPPASGAK
ncbi:mitochondrial inner membrane protein required for protein import [Tulasnella sp. JGI-2019a]|nr:mitochondrial inner membrane protein required for protein import [Tulasnella sp. JGI-2019a]KAG9004229.1 mitochondrial inner membrane protein required for protein import [Tulasnella sp. JGI-2019a]